MKIYFGHSRMTYDTPQEKEALRIIADYYPEDCEIVNPNTPEHQKGCWNTIKDGSKEPGKEINYFLDLAKPCGVGCFLQYYNTKWSAGSAAEANYMFTLGKSIFQIDLIKWKLHPIRSLVEAFTFKQTHNMLSDNGIKGYKKL
jgi:hypothetical protein